MKTLLILIMTSTLGATELPEELKNFQESRVEVYGKMGMIPPPLSPHIIEYVKLMSKLGKMKVPKIKVPKRYEPEDTKTNVYITPLSTRRYDVSEIFED